MVLVEHKADCCGCGACALVCPTGAIRMKTDENGCIYPEIQQEKCISCGLCKARCAFQHVDTKTNERQQVYALCRKDSERLMRSASGGVFAAIAEQWIEAGGIVYGAALSRHGEVLVPIHLQASTAEELEPLLGSKYVQSDVTAAYPAVRQNLREGRQVLFSGTPCQVAGLKSYLKQEYENLLTIDLVCHGVPGADWFAGYLSELEKRLGGKVQDFRFRDKHHGWGLNARLEYQKKGQTYSKEFPSNASSYYELFLNSEIYRESCYRCPYANGNHPADLTIGDYWGIEEEHPDRIVPNGQLDPSQGVSVLIVNTQKGADHFDRCRELFYSFDSSFEKAARHNRQLCGPSVPGANRAAILHAYQIGGYPAVEHWFARARRRERTRNWMAYHLHHDIPEPIRKGLKNIIRRIK